MVLAQHEALDLPVQCLLQVMLDKVHALQVVAVLAAAPEVLPALPQGELDPLDQRAAALHHVIQHLLRGEIEARKPEPADLGLAVHV